MNDYVGRASTYKKNCAEERMELSMEGQLTGHVNSVVYQNEDNGYAVIRVETSDADVVTAVGCLPFAAPGEKIEAVGRWVTHPNHGNQFSITDVRRRLPSTARSILEYLGSGVVKGIGKATAKLIVDKFGADALNILERTPQRLSEVNGITQKRAQQIGMSYSQQTNLRKLMEFVASYGIFPQIAIRLLQRYGTNAIQALKENPYVLLDSFFNVDFALVDAMALEIGIDEDSPLRCQAAILFELDYNLGVGHVYIPKNKLINVSAKLIGAEDKDISDGLDKLEAKREVIIDKNGACYLDYVYEAECYVAEFVAERSSFETNDAAYEDNLKQVLAFEKEMSITYADKQRQAVLLGLQSRLMLLIGGPGTGKTTVVKGLLSIFKSKGLKPALAAPTGRAAKRMSELTGYEAKTIHRTLEFGRNPESGELVFMKNEKEPLEADIIIVDETSMVDLLLMHRLMLAIKPEAILILVGDPEQLPSVGPGAVLEEILETKKVNTVKLTEIYRQARESKIIVSAHEVNKGIKPSLKNTGGDFFFMRRKDDQSAIDTMVELCAYRLPNKLGLDPSEIQVISPTRKGQGGTINLNRVLQEALNPSDSHKLEKRIEDTLFREGDRVMQVKNNYDLRWYSVSGETNGLGVFNGETGVIHEIDLKSETVRVLFDGRYVEYSFEEMDELELAYAITVHKAQGSEYCAVIMSVLPGPAPLMTRRILYTGITRAKNWLILVGDEDVVGTMVHNNRRDKRYSGLTQRICLL